MAYNLPRQIMTVIAHLLYGKNVLGGVYVLLIIILGTREISDLKRETRGYKVPKVESETSRVRTQ